MPFTDSSLMAVYFVFNTAYPRKVEAKLDFFQRCFLQINPTSGTKAKKRHEPGSVTRKVLTFVEPVKRHKANDWVFDDHFHVVSNITSHEYEHTVDSA